MSYILDALRRADAERERGHVPGLHAQPLTAAARAPRLWPRLLGALVVGALASGAGGWWLMGHRPAASAPAPAPAAPAPAAAPAPPPAPTLRAAAAPPAPGTMAPARLPSTPPGTVPATPLATLAPAATTASMTPLLRPAAGAAPRPEPAPAAASTATAAEPPVVPFDRLSDEDRRGVPALAISGAIYSDVPASRMLVVGGQLLHEGDSTADGIRIETIGPRWAVLRWRNLRFKVEF